MSNTQFDTSVVSEIHYCDPLATTTSNSSSQLLLSPMMKKKRNLPGNPDPSAEVIALSPKTLMATNRFVCDICHKGFQRDQNLQLHRRGHNLPWKLRQKERNVESKKKVYVCPEESCVHHNPCRALGDLTGIKKHYSRKHGEKTWKCGRCSKKYAVQSDWKAHSKICGSKEYKCDCGTIFSRRDSFMTHRAFCDALAQENKLNQSLMSTNIVSRLQAQGQIYDNTNTPTVAFDISNLSHGANNATMAMTLQPAMPVPLDATDDGLSSYHTNPSSGLHLRVQSPMGPGEIEDKSDVLAHVSATTLLHRASQLSSCVNNWPMWPVMQRRTSMLVGPGLGPYGPLKQFSELNQVVGNINHSSANPYYCNWLNEMGMYTGDQIFVRNSEGLLKNIEQEDGIATVAGDGSSESAMTLDFLGVEYVGKLHAQQELEIGTE